MRTLHLGLRPFFPAFCNEMSNDSNDNGVATYKPAANIIENEKDYQIELAIPGFAKEEVKIDFEENMLNIVALHEEKEESKSKYAWNEFAHKTKYQRSFQLSENINTESIQAAYENGVLKITLPKKEEQPKLTKQITIS